MFELKPISKEAVPYAIERAARYRLLNEPIEAESICLDVLEVEPTNQRALVTLLLALTDQFDQRLNENLQKAREVLARLEDDYSKDYYQGIIHERRGTSSLKRGSPGCGYVAYDWLRQAMECYEKAAELRPAGNDEAILRWNTCVRIINRDPSVRPEPEDAEPQMLE